MKYNAFRKALYTKREEHVFDIGYDTSQHDMFVPMLFWGAVCGAAGYIIAFAVM